MEPKPERQDEGPPVPRPPQPDQGPSPGEQAATISGGPNPYPEGEFLEELERERSAEEEPPGGG